ncbi:MAG: hypothetical protein ACAI35_05530 [Candidatus Methylacidiphilales bacterium]
MKHFYRYRRLLIWGPRHGSALLICLAFVSLMTMTVISFLVMARMERASSNLAFDRVQAELLADVAADSAVERLREVIDSGRRFDAGSYCTWASEPGRIHIFEISQSSGAVSRTSYDMFSAPPGPDSATTPDLNNVDLNVTTLSGRHLVTGRAPGTMKIGWKNVLANPSAAASATNPITGRIAYWVDDESCKVNINTANGAHKNDTPRQMDSAKKYSYGYGVPSEIDLSAFPGITASTSDGIGDYAASANFNSVSEVGQVAGVPTDFVADNVFSLTYSSRSPDLNMLGEPRIPLLPTFRMAASPNRILNALVGPYGGNTGANTLNVSAGGTSDVTKTNTSGPMDFLYPQSNQLPNTTLVTPNVALPQFMQERHYKLSDVSTNTDYRDYPYGLRIAKYLQGFNSLNQPFKWPRYPGTDDGFAAKYSQRQIDSIVLQIMDVVGNNVLADQISGYTLQGVMLGFLSKEVVCGIGRAPSYSELLMELETGVSSTGPYITFKTRVENYFSKYFQGAPLDYFRGNIGQWAMDSQTLSFNGGTGGGFNTYDICSTTQLARDSITGLYPAGGYPAPSSMASLGPCVLVQSPTPIPGGSGYWQNNMLRVLDGAGQPSGIDVYGWPSKSNAPYTTFYPDPEQGLAELFHPWTKDTTSGNYSGANTATTEARPFFRFLTPASTSGSSVARFAPGSASAITSFGWSVIRYGKKDMTSIQIRGGVAMWTHTESGNTLLWNFAPMDAIAGPLHLGIALDTAERKQRILDAVVPVNMDTAIPGKTSLLLRTADPLINKFPGDWESITNPGGSDVTLIASNSAGDPYARHYAKDGSASLDPDFPATYANVTNPENFDCENPGLKPKATNGGDPLSVWLPNQDLRIPKLARFPSIGALNSIRTGMIPDDMTGEYSKLKGTPWRSICFDSAGSAGQRTKKGTYPDWAMLDLFYVPFLPQDPEVLDNKTVASTAPRRLRTLTSGGSTEGRININNPRVPYPFAESFAGVAQTPPERLSPLKALFKNVQTCRSYDAGGNPVYTAVDHEALANAVQSYLEDNGPFMLTGELANVPEVADHTYRGVNPNAWSRNDLVRKVVGATTTQSNTFSIWVVAQTIKKAPQNTNYGTYESGDQITGEVRRRYMVERLIEPGKDGVPGNAKSLGVDKVLATADDVINADYHPKFDAYPLPYRWRILSMEDMVR